MDKQIVNRDSWYFAYGSNLLAEQKAGRAHDKRIRGGDERPRIATLEGSLPSTSKAGKAAMSLRTSYPARARR